MTSTLVDSNIFLDIFRGGDGDSWSRHMLGWLGGRSVLVLNPVIWSEIGASFGRESDVEDALRGLVIERRPIPFSAAFVAGQTHLRYRRAGGHRERTLPDFLVGAHARVEAMSILTRDPSRYRSYFPDIEVFAPDTRP